MMASNINHNCIKSVRIKIAIDTVFFNMPYSGISRVWENIFSHLDQATLDVELILLIRGKDIPKNILKSGFHTRFPLSQIMHINEFAYPIMQQDVDYLNQLALHHKWNYFLSTYFTYCTSIPNILLIHDMIPETCNLANNHMWIQKDLAIRNATQFICISNITKSDLLRIYPYLAATTEAYPISVINNSIQIEPPLATLAGGADASLFFNTVLRQRGIQPQHYILTIATNQEAYKNQTLVKNLIDKYQSQLAQKLESPIPLVVITKNVPNPNGAGIIANGVLLLSDVSDAALHVLYKNAAIFINPSLAEGFGLPVFEAFSHNVPVIACALPVYEELCPGAITYTENNADDLYQKISSVLKRNSNIQRRIETGAACAAKYTIDKQVSSYREYFNSLGNENENINGNGYKFLNVLFQSYPETNPARRAELEHCILANLEHPAIKYIHDFAAAPHEYLSSSITNHPKYIHVPSVESKNGAWLTYKTAFTYSSTIANMKKFGIYWGIINCDIMLAPVQSQMTWPLVRGWLNSGYILAQSRHEYDPVTGTAAMDANFSKLMHANTQDGWFYSSEKQTNQTKQTKQTGICDIRDCDFEIGMLGCDNAIAHRLLSSGCKVINMPRTFPIWHFDISRGKNSSNFLEKHKQLQQLQHQQLDSKQMNNKPKNTHPERLGQALIPNYDIMMESGGGASIDLVALINQLGGVSNWEKYKLIAEMITSRVFIYNP